MKKLFCFQALEVFRKQQTPISMRYLESILCFQDSIYQMRQRHNFSENAKKTSPKGFSASKCDAGNGIFFIWEYLYFIFLISYLYISLYILTYFLYFISFYLYVCMYIYIFLILYFSIFFYIFFIFYTYIFHFI